MSNFDDAISHSFHPQNILLNFPELPPFAIHAYEFLRHFAIFFLLPITTVVFCAHVAATIALRTYRTFFAPCATSEEIYEDALEKLKKVELSRNTSNRASIASRERALDQLRLAIQLRPDMVKSYIVLATELFHGDLHDSLRGDSNQETWKNLKKRNNTTLRRREPQTTRTVANNVSMSLVECQDLIKRGLAIDPKNDSLIKLQNEVDVVNRYGSHGAHAKMMSIGSFGWMQ
mmetsp:Transcript_23973/g.57872  ORF Transcript_23973/g.57872 Transcript_23973/m.57872 type:complete len:232 (-) Transcript_23973:41-736(-)